MITFRNIIEQDGDWLVDVLAVDMLSLLGEPDLLNKEYLKGYILPLLLKEGVAIAAFDGETPIGCIGGLFLPIFLNPSKSTLSEIFWWVKEEYRGSSAGARLLLLFEGVGLDKKVDFINMTVMPNTSLNTNSLIKRGYINTELSFVRKL